MIARDSAGGPIYIAIETIVFDVTPGAGFYGPGGGYAHLAGGDGSRALAKMSLDAADVADPRTDDLTEAERKTEKQWFDKFVGKYKIVGRLVK